MTATIPASPSTTVERVAWLGSITPTDNTVPTSVRSGLFGELCKLAWPFIEHYHSDLYHDARWLDTYVLEPMVLFYSANDCGTVIGCEERYVRLRGSGGLWRIELTVTPRGRWEVHITELELS
jgi:hypothetical protein